MATLTVAKARKFLEQEMPRLDANKKAMLRDIREGNMDMKVGHLREALGSAVFDAVGLSASHNALQEGYGEVPQDWRNFVQIRSTTDFKTINSSALSGFANPLEVKENGPYVEANLVDQKISYNIAKYGNILRLSLEATMNDEMGAFQRKVRDMGNAFANLLNESIIGVIIDGSATFDVDSQTLFHSTHSNLTASSGGLALSTVESNLAKLMNQTGRNSEKIYLRPKGILCSPSLYMTASEIVSSTMKVGGSSTVAADNAVSRLGLNLVVSPHVDSVSTTWYLYSDKPCIEIAFLNGKQEPEVFMEPENTGGQFYNDSIAWKFRLPFGADIIDYRGMVKSIV